MITMEMQPKEYWLHFNHEWNILADEAYDAGQLDMGLFFAELADDAADVWAGLIGPID